MEKFAVDLDKVLDEFELNEGDEYVNNGVVSKSVENYNDSVSSQYGQYYSLPPKLVKTVNTSCRVNENHIGTAVPTAVNQPLENINLDEADFAPSSRTASDLNDCENIGNKTFYDSFNDKSSNRTPNGHAAIKELLTDSNKNHFISPENFLKDSNKILHTKNNLVSENKHKSNLSNINLTINNLQTDKNDSIECKEKEPDVVQVYSPTMQRLSTGVGVSENGIDDNASLSTLPDVMVVSSNVISDTETQKQTEIHEKNDLVKNDVNIFSNCDSDLNEVTDTMNGPTNEMSSRNDLTSSETCENVSAPEEREVLELVEASTAISDQQLISEEKDQPNVYKNESSINISKIDHVSSDGVANNSPLRDEQNKELLSKSNEDRNTVGFSDDVPVVNESEVEDYLKYLDSPYKSCNKVASVESKDHHEELQSVDVKHLETEVSMKRAIDEIDGCVYNTGARPKKTLISFEKCPSNVVDDILEKKLDFRTEDSVAPATEDALTISEEDVKEQILSDVKLESFHFSDGQDTPDVLTNCKEIEISSSDEFSQGTGAASGSAIRRQRPTSLNLPRLNLGLPSSQSADNISSSTSHSIPSQIPEFLSSRGQTTIGQANTSGQSNPQRPSSLCVGTPFNSLVSTVVQPPGHTPGTVLGIPDLCNRLEASDQLLGDSAKEDASPSPSLSSQSGCSVSTSPSETPSRNLPVNNISPNVDSSPVTSTSTEDEHLGRVAPYWMPDKSTLNCMMCDTKFTFMKRRHHCRGCGKVLCSQCCNLKAKIQYMDYKGARVCQSCFEVLSRENLDDSNCPETFTDNLPSTEASTPQTYQGRGPNPNNPSEYCSTIPPLQQAMVDRPPPVVMVPVGVLKREGSKNKGEPKQVIFSDGIRPGGDLTEVDATPEPAILCKKPGRTQKKINRSVYPLICCTVINSKPVSSHDSLTATDNESLQNSGLNTLTMDQPEMPNLIETLQDEEMDPVPFIINNNLSVLMKIVNLDCCVNLVCWCFCTKGMCTIGQDEIVIVLHYLSNETDLPLDVFRHLSYIYDEAFKGNILSDMCHSLVTRSFLGSKEHGGFLYIRPTFQCLNKLILPPAPYLFGILLDKWETPWAKVFPMRLMLRLGAEFRYYPCPVVSYRFRKSVFCEIGHTIMNVLADFRNYQYVLPSVKGMVTQMEDKKTFIKFPRNRYDEVMKVLSNSNEHVLALSCNFNTEADSHLVCIQNEEGHYETQAINIQNKARKVTGASFVVFNGALKSSSGLSAKSSIVEDGLMVQISPDTMLALRQSLRDMNDFTIGCGPLNVAEPEEVVLVKWVEDDKSVNVGMKSVVDGMELDGIKSIRIHNGTDYMGDTKLIRWTEVFLVQTDEDENCARTQPINISRLSETLAQACCIALTPHLEQLKESGISKIGLRCTINSEKVEYEVGANGEKLPNFYMNDLDSQLVPVIHGAASNSHDGVVILELVFFILEN
ncbi:Zinc finger FYVE domain-containing protein 9 [Nymphon striatum]|nr:Zinc finger FYVE domain-containing protein 9 [Nymphon striatum]